MMTSLRSCARYPSGGTPPIEVNAGFELALGGVQKACIGPALALKSVRRRFAH